MPTYWKTWDQRTTLCIFTIFARPLDFPAGYVVRRYEIRPRTAEPCEGFGVATLEAARAMLPPGLVCVGRDHHDEPHIVESWL